MKVILLGPPGAGKGTQAARLAKSIGVRSVSSGGLFRDHQDRDTELGRMARSYMERGVLVPDRVTIDMVMGWINGHRDAGGFLLDGFPRTIAQAKTLDQALVDNGGVDRALYINLPREVLIRRLTGRVLCRACQISYHLIFAPPGTTGKCDRCGGELYQRDDDKPKAVGKRIQVYLRETEPLVDYYRSTNILREVNGDGLVEEVAIALIEALN